MTDRLTYVYCLVRSARRPMLRGAPPGMPGGEDLRALDAGGGLWLIVTSVPAVEYDEASVTRGLQNLDWVGRRAMAHEAVVEHFLGAAAVLPMQLFALFISDERALSHVERDRRRIDRILARIDRQLEWGLRLTFDENAARNAVDEKYGAGQARGAGKAGRAMPAAVSGADYLARKRDLFDVTRVQLREAKSEANRLYRAMTTEATAALRRTAMEEAAPGSRLLLDAAFLVPVRRSHGFRAALRKHARQLDASGIVVSLTGPWPPYNFIDDTRTATRARRKRASAKTPARKRAAVAKRR